ncbi:hypothetical protein [Bacteroides ovatus]|uniref:hypothetical protein n=1 Tax=Bacteroides ovatus TaxID=28116 RepID=UPI0018C92308|nr:hypothetical protein [Bacteroides ovatus]MBG9220333.1 hypothetical protein [Bacteroides ovatus]MBG9233469.1 hypothetical protein [Bacteroides ovatus]
MINSAISRKEKRFLYLSFFYIIYMIFPLFSDYSRIPNYIPGIVVVVSILCFYKDYINTKILFWFICYAGAMFLLGLCGHRVYVNGLGLDTSYIWAIVIETAWILPSLMIMSVLLSFNNCCLYRIIAKGSLILLSISFLYILPMLTISKGYLRASLFSGDELQKPMGLPDYSLMHAYTIVLLPLFWMVKNQRGRDRFISLLLSILFSYIVIQTSVSTSIVISVLMLLFVVIMNPNNKNISFVKFSILAFILMILYEVGTFLWLVDILLPYFEGTAVEPKLLNLRDSMTLGYVTGDHLTVRMEVQKLSQTHFWTNPIFGYGAPGRHSKFWDILGSMGVFVGFPFIMLLWTSLKKWTCISVSNEMRVYVIAEFVASFVFIYSKGIFSAEGWLFMTVIVPCIIMYQARKDALS